MKEAVRLNQANLDLLSGRIACPSYDRSRIKTGIVHVGVGGFHRSHQAWYTDALMNMSGASGWGICGVGLRGEDLRMRNMLKKQDYLYALIAKHPDGRIETRVIGSIIDFLLSSEGPGVVIDRMADPDTRIVSLTITEGGYNFNPVTDEFEFGNPDVQHDLANPDSPGTVFGYLASALKKRRAAGIPPFTIQSCDNIQHNGDMTRKMLLAFAGKQDPDLARWIEREVCFPNAMVDRITPVTTPADIEYLKTEIGVDCAWPVTCEPFHQWVVEDRFPAGRPAWEKVGAQFVPDVSPYEKMKLRLLNAGHSVLGLLGSIHGHGTIDGCVRDPLFAAYLRRFMDIEAARVLGGVAGIDLDAYQESLIERFGNPNIKDGLERICLESSAKLPKFLIPTISENLARGGSIEYATLVIAAWCWYSDKRTNRHGKPLEIVDAMKEELHRAAASTGEDKLSFLRLATIFGDLIRNERFTSLYAEMINAIYENPDISLQMKRIIESGN